MSGPNATPKKAGVERQTRKRTVKSKPKTALYSTGDIEDIAYSERSERYPV